MQTLSRKGLTAKLSGKSFAGVGRLGKERNDDRDDAAICSRIDIPLNWFVIAVHEHAHQDVRFLLVLAQWRKYIKARRVFNYVEFCAGLHSSVKMFRGIIFMGHNV